VYREAFLPEFLAAKQAIFVIGIDAPEDVAGCSAQQGSVTATIALTTPYSWQLLQHAEGPTSISNTRRAGGLPKPAQHLS